MHNFHVEGLVHGDLWAANIFCEGDSMKLIDFDWGGKDGEVFYPTANLNDELRDGRVFNDLRIRKEDDRRVLRNTLAKLREISVSAR
jgi:Ser/Thr protein kinase RdoA (MazF antagonist)